MFVQPDALDLHTKPYERMILLKDFPRDVLLSVTNGREKDEEKSK